jgi:hypothetical protein
MWQKTLLIFLMALNAILADLMLPNAGIQKAEADTTSTIYAVWDKYTAFYGWTEPPHVFAYGSTQCGYTGPSQATWDPFNNTWILSGWGGGSYFSLSGGVLIYQPYGSCSFYKADTAQSGRKWIPQTLVQADIIAPDGTYPDGYNAADGYYYVRHADHYYWKVYDYTEVNDDDYAKGPNLLATDVTGDYTDNSLCYYKDPSSGQPNWGWCVKDRRVDKFYYWTVYNATGFKDVDTWDYWVYSGISNFTGYTGYTFDSTTGNYAVSGSPTSLGPPWPKTMYTVEGNTFCQYWKGGWSSDPYLGKCKKFPQNKNATAEGSTVLRTKVRGLDQQYPDNGLYTDGNWWVKDLDPTVEVVAPTPSQMLSDFNTAFVPTATVSNPRGGTLTLTYYIDSETSPRDTRMISNTQMAQTVSFNAINIGTLTEGPHTIRFTASDGTHTAEGSASFAVDKTAPSISTTVGATDTTIQISGAASDSISGLNSEPYRYSIGSNASSWTASSSFTQSNLTPNTVYTSTFEVKDNVGHISNQDWSIRTKAQIPAFNVSQAGENSLRLAFTDNNPSGTEYQVKFGDQYVSGTGALTATPVWITPTNKMLQATGLQPNTTYGFQAKARNAIGEETANSVQVSGTTLASPPAPITTEASQSWMKLSWPGTAGVSSYDVEADGTVVNSGTSTTYTHTGLTPNTQHHYRVRANNAGGTGNWSPQISAVTLPDPPPAPTDLQAVPSQTAMTVSWDIAARADSYEIEADGVVIDNGSQTTFTHSGLQPFTDHTYRIRAKNAGGTSDWSAPIVQKTLPYPPQTPQHGTAEPSIYSIKLTWDAAEGVVDGYEVEADSLIVDVGNTTEYTHEGLEPVSGHTYRIRAKNAGGKSPWSDPIVATTHPEKPSAPTNIIGTSEESSITLTWYQVMYTDSYDVEIDGTTIVNVDKNQFEHEGLTPDQKHTYRIRAKNISGDGPWSAPVTMGTLPAGSGTTTSLTNVAAIVTNRTITISWDTVAPDAKYDVEVDGVLSDNGTDTIYHHTGLAANEFHTYKIRVKDNDNVGEWVAILSLSTLPDPPDAPTNIEAFPTTNSIELHWDKTNGATGYDVEVDGQTNELGAENSYTHQGLAPGTAHQYRVRAKNITGVTAWSPFIVKSTTSPDYLVNVSSNKTFDLSLYAYNVQDFSEKTFVVHYNPDEAGVVDLYNFTPKQDVASGNIPGSNLTASYTPGTITFKVNQNVVPGTSWSGELTTITFKAKINGQTTINAIVQ